MIQEHINILTLREFFVIESTVTHKPYLDKDYGCYLFELKSEATDFINGVADTTFGNARTLTQVNFCTEFYQLGIQKINVKLRDKKNLVIPLERKDVRRAYFNNDTNGLLLRLMETKQKKYLRELNGKPFLVPVIIDERQPRQYPNIHYPYIKMENEKNYFVLFSTLAEFTKWNEEQGNKYQSMELEIEKFSRVRKNSPVMINPLSDKLILTDTQLKMMEKYKREESY